MQRLNLPTRIYMFSICSSIEFDLKMHILKSTDDISFSERMIQKAKERKNNSNIEMTQEKILNLLDLSDYIEIILNEPYKYKLNNPNCMMVNEYFSKIIPIRNRVMHTKPLEVGDKSTLVEIFYSIDVDIKFIEWKEVNKTREILEKEPLKLMSTCKNVEYSDNNYFHNLPEPEFDDTGYIGRKKEIKEITNLIIEEKYPVISIIGNGGIGKTAITVKILYDLIDNPQNPYEAIIWISLKAKTLSNGEFIEIQNAISNMNQLISATQKAIIIDDEKEPIENIVNFMKNFKSLLVIDNLETINDKSINTFIKSIPKESKVLITSRTGLGELEYRYDLNGMNQNDSINYFRELSKYYGLDLWKRSECEILSLVRDTLYSNPLSIKWYINGVCNGVREENIQNNKNELIEFCMSNVYNKLTNDAKEILKLFQISDFELSYGEIKFYLEKDDDLLTKAINELLATNMMKMPKYEYQIDAMAKDYLQIHKMPSKEFVEKIAQKKKQLNDMLQDIKVKKENSILEPNSILYDYENKDNKIAAIYLYKALDCGRKKMYEDAFEIAEIATNIAPNYFECYRIKGFLNANAKNLSEAIKNYEIAINKCTRDLEYAISYYVFSFFYTVTMEDNEKANELICKAEKYFPDNPEIQLQKVRTMTRLGKFEEAEKILNAINKEKIITDKVKNIQASVTANLYKKWSEVVDNRDEEEKLKYLKMAIESVEQLDKKDQKTYVTLLSVLKELAFMYYNTNALILLKEIISKNYSNLQSINHNDMNIIKKTIFEHQYEIDENIFEELRKYLTDYNLLAKRIKQDNLGVVVFYPKPFGFIANAYNSKIYFNKNRLKTVIEVGDVVKFNLKQTDKGFVAINVKKTNISLEDFDADEVI